MLNFELQIISRTMLVIKYRYYSIWGLTKFVFFSATLIKETTCSRLFVIYWNVVYSQ